MGLDRRRGGRRKRRPSGESAFSFARQITLAPITSGTAVAVSEHLIEPAWDGHRVLATRVGDDVRIAALDFRDWTQTFPAAARALAKLTAQKLAIDGVVCVLDERGVPSFDKLREAVAAGAAVTDAVVICWDLLWDGDEDLRTKPLTERRKRLTALLGNAPRTLMHSEALQGSLARVLEAAAPLGLRGVVARPLGGDYTAPWCAFSTSSAAIDFRRSLSPPPPLSNADKVLYPRDGICKRDIVAYYRDVAPLLLPHLLDRPVVIQRWPDGIDEFDWYQHRVPPRAPDYIRAAYVDGVRRIVIENADALLWMVNQAGLTYHGFLSRLSTLAEPDVAMIDLDPGDKTTWPDIVEIALAVRRLLELLELPSVLKTSGQRGLHILIPLAPGHTFAQAEELCRGVARMLLRLMPDKITDEQEKKERGGKLLVDTKQFMAKTLVVPYSLRAADGATLSTPLAWDELTPKLDPRQFTLRSVRSRLDAKGDVAAPLLRGTTKLEAALTLLRRQ
ncbi:MAG TPA: non-homologous end-joining DNA ligase [Kofleriaceae bacterium]|nr:non-homologous end-joining DNA ligase [Kofleriaceae bacterium]